MSGALASAVSVTSSDTAVAKVDLATPVSDPSGSSTIKVTITALKAGSANITASLGDKSAVFAVTVSNVDASGVSIDGKDSIADLPMRRSVKLSASVSPDDTTFKDITWASSDESIATVAADGTVTGVKQGEATITATCGDKSDSVTIKVTDPVIKASEVTNLPSSYTASVTHNYQVDVINDGKTSSTPFTFKTDSKITSNYSGTKLAYDVPAMEITANDADYRYVQFKITKAGTYRLFSNNQTSTDTKLNGIYPVNDDGTVSATKLDGSSVDDGGSYGGKDYCKYGYDFYLEIALEEGKSYVAEIKVNNTTMLFGVVNVETADEVTTVTSATGIAPKKDISDSYSATYLADSFVYSVNRKDGAIGADGKVYSFDYDAVAEEYTYNNNDGVDGSLSDFFSWNAILSDANLKWQGTDTESKCDLYFASFPFEGIKISPIGQFAGALGFADAIDGIYVTSNYETNAVSLSACFKGEDKSEATAISIAEATEAPITVTGYDVNPDGEAGDDSGVIDIWGE